MIEVENLSKSYDRFQAVDSISFSVKKGEILGFLGPNGAGKTTTMRMLTCFMPPTSGRAVIAGFDCAENPLEVKSRIGYVPESAPLYQDMKVIEFLDFAASVKNLHGADIVSEINIAMEKTGIVDVKEKMIGKLSKGYRQRVCLAQALLGNPEVLILDEPTAGLDPVQIVEIRRLIKELSGERTVILSTHILPEVSILCDRVMIISKGKIVAEDTPQNLTGGVTGKSVIEVSLEGEREGMDKFLASIDGVTALTPLETFRKGESRFSISTAAGQDIRRVLSSAIINKGYGLLELKPKLLSLEDVFMDLVTDEEQGGEGDE